MNEAVNVIRHMEIRLGVNRRQATSAIQAHLNLYVDAPAHIAQPVAQLGWQRLHMNI